MASAPTMVPPTGNTLIVVKVAYDGNNRKFKFPLRELNAVALPGKLRASLRIPEDGKMRIERFSDSSGSFITLDPEIPSTYKQLYRAAKAKLVLRLKITVIKDEVPTPKKEHIINVPITGPEPKALPMVLQPNPDAMVETPSEEPKATLSSAMSCWQVFCNNCDKVLTDAHFHCSICDKGDYDLCEACVEAGKLCPGDGHWLIKRFIKDGKVVNSTTEKASVTRKDTPPIIKTTVSDVTALAPRTCNSCIKVLPANLFINCKNCPDFDLCSECFITDKHGHNPAHSFGTAVTGAQFAPEVNMRLLARSGVRHFALCDGCDKTIIGTRHKCLDCPDFDFCGVCINTKKDVHPRHRFVPLYEPLETLRRNSFTIHTGVFCDGLLCTNEGNKQYIRGDRYKCAVCADVDFCANCEAHPCNKHNVTHPLLKIKSPITGIDITTLHDSGNGRVNTVGDKATAETSLPIRNAKVPTPRVDVPVSSNGQLDAKFIEESVTDGTILPGGHEFLQTWTLRNPGPGAWPAGCCVKYTGGDDMLRTNSDKAIDVSELKTARESNIAFGAVMPGEEVTFTVKLRTPTREGKCISYWRLSTADGFAFGNKLWCDVVVKPEEPSWKTEIARMQEAEPFDARYEEAPDSATIARVLKASKMKAAAAAAAKYRKSKQSASASKEEVLIPELQAPVSQPQDTQSVLGKRFSATQAEQPEAMKKSMMRQPELEYPFGYGHARMPRVANPPHPFHVPYPPINPSYTQPPPQPPQSDVNSQLLALEAQNLCRLQAMRQEHSTWLNTLPGADAAKNAMPCPPLPRQLSYARPPPPPYYNNESLAAVHQRLRNIEQHNRMRLQQARAVSMPTQSLPTPFDSTAVAALQASTAQLQANVRALVEQTEKRSQEAAPPIPAKELVVPQEASPTTTTPLETSTRATVEDVDEAEKSTSSSMVFPKLEKESPASSTHQDQMAVDNIEASAHESVAPSVDIPPTVDTEMTIDGDEIAQAFEEVETVGDVESEDDGFETDDYDILDASDEEVMSVNNGKPM